ncbi:MAG TPA: RluA family pseudouridine synthase [Chitinophagaceae bacterium]|nr:RluA family pseudouridine synthase [Chitinophagaceae bacterium]
MKVKDWIIYQDDHLIAVNKPSGVLSIPDREGKEISLKRLLQHEYDAVYTVHRLDKDTSGLLIFARTEESHRHLSQQFENRQTKKIYAGLVVGVPPLAAGAIDAPIAEHPVKPGVMVVNRKGKESLTDYKVLQSFGICSWMEFRIHTGRTHQIRVHMKDAGFPIVCDNVYGDGKPLLLSSIKPKFKLSKYEEEERPLVGRLALHAWQLQFSSLSGKEITLEAAIPKDLRAALQQLGKWQKGKSGAQQA